MASDTPFRATPTVAALLLFSATAAAEMNMNIPPPPDPAVTRSVASREYDGFEIRIAPAVKIPVNIPQLLRNACRTQKDIWACTFFASERLECNCTERERRWRLDAVVDFVPVMYLRSSRFQEHEEKHVEHVTGLLSGYLRELVGRDFSSQVACLAAAQEQMAGFGELMNGFRAASNRKLH